MPDVGYGCSMLRGKTSLFLVWPLWFVLINSISLTVLSAGETGLGGGGEPVQITGARRSARGPEAPTNLHVFLY